MLTESDFLADLRAHIARHYITQTMAAMHWQVSPAYLSLVVSGQKSPNARILKEVGYTRRKLVVYERVAND